MGCSQSQLKPPPALPKYPAENSKTNTSYTTMSKNHIEFGSSPAPSPPPPNVWAELADDNAAPISTSNLSILSAYKETLSIEEFPEIHFSLPLLSQDIFSLPPDIQHNSSLEPPRSPNPGNSYLVSRADRHKYGTASGSDTPERREHGSDDSVAMSKPLRQVDYLSHDWREEDIWSSWRYINSRREEIPNSRRLKNASWRAWMKLKNKLKTIPPEELNWLKDNDDTWLYGPLQSSSNQCNHAKQSSLFLSASNSLANLNKKPILKKQSIIEFTLPRSLTTASLEKQPTAAIHAQETRKRGLRPNIPCPSTDCNFTSPLPNRLSRRNNCSAVQSTGSPCTPCQLSERKHIHFNHQVEQCIAVDIKCNGEDEVDVDRDGEDSESKDGERSKRRDHSMNRESKKAAQPGRKTIALLPSTTLKCHDKA